MLKLIKYELIGSYRQYLLTFLIFIIGCIIIPLLPSGMGELISGFFMMALFGIVISIFVNIILSFNNSMFKRPGYLTLTLPVSTNQLIISKVIGAFVWSTIAGIVLLIGMIILMFIVTNTSIGVLFEAIGELIRAFTVNIPLLLQELLIMITSTAALILSFYFTVTLTHTRFIPKYKTFIGIVGYFIVSMVLGYIISTPMIAEFMSSLDGTGYFLMQMIVNIVMIVGFFYGTKYLIDRQIEVE